MPRHLIVDGFYRDPDEVRASALRLRYLVIPDTAFPGWRHQLSPSRELEELLEPHVGQPIRDLVHGFQLTPEACGDVMTVHCDPFALAGVVYLNPNEDDVPGTRLCRHIATGLEVGRGPKFDSAARDRGMSSLELSHWLEADAMDLSRWETVLEVPARFNRLFLYDGDRFHVAAGCQGNEPGDSRLVQAIAIGGPRRETGGGQTTDWFTPFYDMLRGDPASVEAYEGLSDGWAARGCDKNALLAAHKALLLSPGTPRLLARKGLALMRIGARARAEPYMTAFLE